MGCSEDDIIRLGRVIGDAERIVLFTGAGFSVPSGIPDFRSAGGVYSGKFAGYGAEYMLSRECLALHPELFFDFYRSKMLYPDAKPNDAHLFSRNSKSRADCFPSSPRTSTDCIRRRVRGGCGNCTEA